MYIYAMHMASGRSRPGYQIQATAINQATVETVPDPQPAVPPGNSEKCVCVCVCVCVYLLLLLFWLHPRHMEVAQI